MAAAGDPRGAGVRETTSYQFLGVCLCLFQLSTPMHNTPNSVLSLVGPSEHLELSHTNFCRHLRLYGVFTGV